MICTPDEPKVAILSHLLAHGKHVLVEKPLYANSETDLRTLEAEARRTGAVCYTAYNHRFEPHYVRMRDLVASGQLGAIYRCRMFYGNGTARLVRNSAWRDSGAGVLPDLGSHLLDTARFWFGDIGDDFRVTSVSRFENRAPDHVVVASETSRPKLELEMTLLSWRNHFTCDVLAERGSAHIKSLCKWGPTTFTHRMRVLPSGRPLEESCDAHPGRSDLGARIRSFQAALQRAQAHRPRQRYLAAADAVPALGRGHQVGGCKRMTTPRIAYAGMTHLGLCSAVAAAEQGILDSRLFVRIAI